MALTKSEMHSEWAENRRHNALNQCACSHCCQSSNVCALCHDWDSTIDWNPLNPPDITCSQCKNSYHFQCLPLQFRPPNSWSTCPDLGADYECCSFTDLFSLLWQRDKSSEETSKYDALITTEYVGMFPNKQLTITGHFCGFAYNGFKFVVGDCAEIRMHQEEAPEICRIVDIFTTDKAEAMLLVQWYRYPLTNEETELYFADQSIDLVAVQNVQCRVRVVDDITSFKLIQQRLEQQKQRRDCRWETLQKNRAQNVNSNKNSTKNPSDVDSRCLFGIKEEEWIPFSKVFWSNKSHHEETMDVYDTKMEDTRIYRMKQQDEMLTLCKTYRDTLKVNMENLDDPEECGVPIASRKRRRRTMESSSSGDSRDSEESPILAARPRKKRKIESDPNLLVSSRQKSLETKQMGKAMDSLRHQLQESKEAVSALTELSRDSQRKLKRVETECDHLKRSNGELKEQVRQMQASKTTIFEQLSESRRKCEVNRNDHRRKEQTLIDDGRRIEEEYERKIRRLKDKNLKLSRNLQRKQDRIRYFEKLRQFDAGNKNIEGAECVMVNQIPALVTDLPRDPRANRIPALDRDDSNRANPIAIEPDD